MQKIGKTVQEIWHVGGALHSRACDANDQHVITPCNNCTSISIFALNPTRPHCIFFFVFLKVTASTTANSHSFTASQSKNRGSTEGVLVMHTSTAHYFVVEPSCLPGSSAPPSASGGANGKCLRARAAFFITIPSKRLCPEWDAEADAARALATSATSRLVSGGGGGAADGTTAKPVMVSNHHVDSVIRR